MPSLFACWLIALTLVLTPCGAKAQVLGSADARAVRHIVIEQLDALAVGDAQRLSETVTPAVREAFSSVGDLLALLQALYPMAYRPRQIGFAPAQVLGAWAVQAVEITDQDDARWLVLFLLEQQPDATWRIGGCLAFENPWLPA
jgi:hypothetical protein